MALDTAKAIAVARGLTTRFDNARDSYTPLWPKLAMTIPSDGADEQLGWVGHVPQMREWLGDRIFNQLRAATLVVEHREYENSILVDRKDIEDDRYGFYGEMAANLADEAMALPDTLLLSEIENGGSIPVADGQYFFDTDHSWGGSGTQSNALSINIADPANPTATEMKTSFNTAVNAMIGFKNDQGVLFHRGIVNRMSDLAIVIPKNYRQATYEAFESVIIGNNTNVVIDKPEIITLPQLAATDKFYVFHTGGRLKPFVYMVRRPLKRHVKGFDDREFKEIKFMVDWRGRMRAVAWMKAVRITHT